MRNSQSIITDRFKSLPNVLQDVMTDVLTRDTVQRISLFHHLSDEQTDRVAFSVGNVLLGFVHYNDFVRDLEKETGLNLLICQSIAKEIDRDIFLPVRKSLRQLYASFPVGTTVMAADTLIDSSVESIPQPEKIIDINPVKDFKVSIPVAINNVKQKEGLGNARESELGNAPEIIGKTPEQPKKSFFAFFKSKRSPAEEIGSSSIGANVIVGKQESVKPILENTTPFVISFDDVGTQKEKLVSSMETAQGSKVMASASAKSESSTLPKPLNIGTIISKSVTEVSNKEVLPLQTVSDQFKFVPPVKIVNYGSIVSGQPLKTEAIKEQLSSTAPEKTKSNIPSMASSSVLPKPIEIKGSEPVKPVIPPISQPSISNPPVLPASVQSNISPKPDQSVPEKAPQVPPENVVDLRKFKF